MCVTDSLHFSKSACLALIVPAHDVSQSEFDNLFQSYADVLGITKDDIVDELSDAKEMMANLRKKGREDTARGKSLQRRIGDFERLVELRSLTCAASGHCL